MKVESDSEVLTPGIEDHDVIDLEERNVESVDVDGGEDSISSESDDDSHTPTPCTIKSESSAGEELELELELENPASDDYSADSDFSEEVDERRYFDATDKVWHCEACDELLVDDNCPAGHAAIVRCQTCGWKVEQGLCPRCQPCCDDCGTEKLGSYCDYCQRYEGSGEDEDVIAFDIKDEVWRCIHCCWEIEPQKGGDGSCFCLNEAGEKHHIDLSECPDYEPADADYCDSEDDDVSDDEEEPTSEDEAFIDNEGENDDDGDSMDIEQQVEEALVDA